MRYIPTSLTKLSLIGNKLLGGKDGYSICATVYEGAMHGSPSCNAWVKIIDKIFFWDAQHCRKAWLLRNKP